jgi:hypothetical protein
MEGIRIPKWVIGNGGGGRVEIFGSLKTHNLLKNRGLKTLSHPKTHPTGTYLERGVLKTNKSNLPRRVIFPVPLPRA